MQELCTTQGDERCITEESFKANYRWREVWGKQGPPVWRSKTSLAGRGMNCFSHVVETVCGWPGASRESMVTMFSAGQDASMIIKRPMKSG
uniref:Uncharacterized protein n=1 Tax=Romanomermis culicivorax TaxID=13658 RepID=A0A915IF39_ROMCU